MCDIYLDCYMCVIDLHLHWHLCRLFDRRLHPERRALCVLHQKHSILVQIRQGLQLHPVSLWRLFINHKKNDDDDDDDDIIIVAVIISSSDDGLLFIVINNSLSAYDKAVKFPNMNEWELVGINNEVHIHS